MNSVRYVGLDVHRDTISVAVLDESGRLIMQSVLATKASAILDFIHGIRSIVHATFEEGTHAAWLYDLLAGIRPLISGVSGKCTRCIGVGTAHPA
jgi:hypothetical protein